MNNKRFHYLKDGKPVGPIPFQELQQMAAANKIGPKDMVWPEGAPNWIPAAQVEGLFVTAPPPAPPPPAPPPAPAPTSAAPAPAPAPAASTSTGRDALVNAAMAGFDAAMGKSPPPKPKTDPIALLKFMLTSLPGAAGFSVIGFLFLCCGGCGMAVSFTGESAPTKVTIAELEKESKKPEKTWLEITEGHVFLQSMFVESKKAGGDTTYTAYYVPLASKTVNEQWTADFIGSKGSSKYSYSKARVILKISPSQLKKDFPDVPEGDAPVTKISQERSPAKGTVTTFSSLPKHVKDKLSERSKDLDSERMVVINYGEEPSSPGFGYCTACFLWLLALPWFVPIGLVLFKRFGTKPAATGPAATTTPAT